MAEATAWRLGLLAWFIRGDRSKGKGDGKGEDGKNKDLFPRYDAHRIDQSSGSEQMTEISSTCVEQENDFVGAIQTHINATRKAEIRVKNIERIIQQKKSQWAQYEADLKKAYQKERDRVGLGQALTRLEDELRAALENEERAKNVLRTAFTASRAAPAGPEESTATVDRLTRDVPHTVTESDGALLTRLFGVEAATWGERLNAEHYERHARLWGEALSGHHATVLVEDDDDAEIAAPAETAETWRPHYGCTCSLGSPEDVQLGLGRAGFSMSLQGQCTCNGGVDLSVFGSLRFHCFLCAAAPTCLRHPSPLLHSLLILACRHLADFPWALGQFRQMVALSSADSRPFPWKGIGGSALPLMPGMASCTHTLHSRCVPNNCIGGSGTVTILGCRVGFAFQIGLGSRLFWFSINLVFQTAPLFFCVGLFHTLDFSKWVSLRLSGWERAIVTSVAQGSQPHPATPDPFPFRVSVSRMRDLEERITAASVAQGQRPSCSLSTLAFRSSYGSPSWSFGGSADAARRFSHLTALALPAEPLLTIDLVLLPVGRPLCIDFHLRLLTWPFRSLVLAGSSLLAWHCSIVWESRTYMGLGLYLGRDAVCLCFAVGSVLADLRPPSFTHATIGVSPFSGCKIPSVLC